MKKLYCLLVVFSFCVANAIAQVKVTARIDSTEILLGEQTSVNVTVVHPADLAVAFPKDVSVLIDKKLEVIGTGNIDEHEDTPEKGTTTSVFSFKLTSFEPALYYIPQLNITVGKKNYTTEQLALKVNDILVDTLHIDKYFGPKEIIEPVYTWKDWMPLLILSILLIICVACMLYVAYIMRKIKKVKVIKVKRIFVPPHKEAATQIEKLKVEYSTGKLTSKDYYTELITILRRYVAKRYGISAHEMTSFELVERLMTLPLENTSSDDSAKTAKKVENTIDARPDYAELREILKTADLTKFAKLKTDENEDRINLIRLSDYIERTKSDMQRPLSDVNEETPDKEQRIKPRLILRLLFGLAIVFTIGVLLLVVKEIFDLLL